MTVRSTLLAIAAVPLVGLGGVATQARADDPLQAVTDESLARLEAQYTQKVTPLLAKYCANCHGPKRPRGGLDVSKFTDAASVARDMKTWETIAEYLDTGEMPPFDQTQPTEEEIATITGWVEAYLSSAACRGPVDPGRVTMRRLNRAEYNNTIRDLVGVDFRPADDFPTDDVGYGFDNIGDVLTLSPILLEKYLAAAEQIAERAIVVRDTRGPVRSWTGGDLQGDGSPARGGARGLASTGEVRVTHDFPADGEYLLRARAYAQQAGDEPARMAFRLDGKALTEVRVEAVEDAPGVYEIRVPVTKGRRPVAVAFTNDFYDPDNRDRNRRDRNLYVEAIEVQGPIGLAVAPGATTPWNPARIDSPAARPYSTTSALLHSRGELAVSHEFPEDGEYVLRVKAFGQRAGDELPRMEFHLDGKTIATFEVEPDDDDEARDFEARVPVTAGTHRFAVAFPNDFTEYTKDSRGRKVVRRDRNLVILGMEVQSPLLTGDEGLPESHRRIVVREPRDPGNPEEVRACAREVVERFASRAYRRPVTPAEVDRLIRFVELGMRDGGSFAQGVRLAVTAVLVSPNFLFRVELDPDAGKPDVEVRALNDFELASRLSYFLWSSMPDEELSRLARAGKLHEEAVLEAQALRMLKDPKVEAGLVENFAVQWLQLRGLESFTADRELFPDFDERLRDDMLTETVLFFEEVLRSDRSLLEFLDSDWTFLNERLAKHYGIGDVKGPEFRKVALSADSRRGGLLTQASVLAVTSNPTRTSPVKRGKWVLEALLGTPPPPPPPNVPELSEEQEAILSGSLRERLERHRADPNCAVCHERLDPLGFVLENYDAVGAWRDKDGTFPIDPSGSLPTGESFEGPADLKAVLVERRDKFVRALAEKMLTYAIGRGIEPHDQCVVDQVALATAERDYRFSSLVVGIVRSPTFRMTQTAQGSKR